MTAAAQAQFDAQQLLERLAEIFAENLLVKAAYVSTSKEGVIKVTISVYSKLEAITKSGPHNLEDLGFVVDYIGIGQEPPKDSKMFYDREQFYREHR